MNRRLIEKLKFQLSEVATADISTMHSFCGRLIRTYFFAVGVSPDFNILDETYDHIYGSVPFTPAMRKLMIDNFKTIVDLRFIAVILDSEDNVVGFGLCFPSLSKALQPSQGHLTIPALFRLMEAKRNPKILDLALIGVIEKYQKLGIASALIAKLMEMMKNSNIEYCETNLNLETNEAIINQWSAFDSVLHKRRRSFVKKITL